jgi:hypothetical protein
MKYLLNTTEIYRVETEEEATELINEAKRDSNYILSKYSSVKREQKAKGEVIDEWYKVTLVKSFNEEKEPAYTVDVIYEV